MRVLVDTHALIWASVSPERLGQQASATLRSRRITVVVSAATAWEIATKVRLGKLPAAVEILDQYEEVLGRLGAEDLAVSRHHALLAGSLRWEHRDPFDRMLAAQAIIEGLPLLSADRVFGTLPGVDLRW